MTSTSSNAEAKEDRNKVIRVILAVLGAIASIFILLWLFNGSRKDAYIDKTLAIEGSLDRGEKLFKVNCVGCHGIAAQGLLGPDLHEVRHRLNDSQIINQIRKGKTPPMPSFEIEPKAMSDLLKYLYSLEET